MKRKILKTVYRVGGFAPFHWAFRDQLLILTYHRFSRERAPHKIARDDFARHLAYLAKRARVFSLDEIAETLARGEALPPNAVALTIDDGYRDAYEVAFPLLREYGFPATVYAVTDFLDGRCWLWTDLMRHVVFATKSPDLKIHFERGDLVRAALGDRAQRLGVADRLNARLKKMPNEAKDRRIREIAAALGVEIPARPTDEFAPLSWDEARAMDRAGVRVESHTVTHPILTNVGASELRFELEASKKRLEEVLGRPVRHFCYPNGGLNESVRDAVAAAGYATAVSTEYGFNRAGAAPFELKRIDAPDAIEHFAQAASGFELVRQKIAFG